MSKDLVGKRVEARYLYDEFGSRGRGDVIAFADSPTVVIETDDGERFSWRADLVQEIDAQIEKLTDALRDAAVPVFSEGGTYREVAERLIEAGVRP